MPAISLKLNAARSRVNARTTLSPFASPPIASRRRCTDLLLAIRVSLFRYTNTCSLCEIPRWTINRDEPPMKIGSQVHRSTAISTSNETTILVRGRDLTQDLIGRIGFTEHFWLLLTGTLPTAAQRRILDATLVAVAEHGLVPSVQVGRMTLAAAPEALQGAVAAGILGCGSVVLGSSEAAGQFFATIAERAEHAVPLDDAAQALVRQFRSEGRAIPGYGHPLHKGYDPRALRLLEVAVEVGIAGRHVAIARLVERVLPNLVGKALSLNVSGAIAAVLLDAGYP